MKRLFVGGPVNGKWFDCDEPDCIVPYWNPEHPGVVQDMRRMQWDQDGNPVTLSEDLKTVIPDMLEARYSLNDQGQMQYQP